MLTKKLNLPKYTISHQRFVKKEISTGAFYLIKNSRNSGTPVNGTDWKFLENVQTIQNC